MIIELPAIIRYQGIRDPVPTDQVSQHEVCCLLLCDYVKGFYLYPLREVVIATIACGAAPRPFGNGPIKSIPY